ncbi:MAG: MATE family efflux transporter [Clostridiales bacterium]|nr:MATE family efflux transporter [Clostridiales bacterium]MDY6116812.1 MATE family efflux transporter [Anaerovoracaceae bacterium]
MNQVKNDTEKTNKMGTMPIGSLLLSMAWPPTLSMSINALYNVVDSVFVAMLSERALTAVSLVMPLQMLMVAIGVGTGVGVNSLIARRLGEQRVDEASLAASVGIRLAFVNYFVMALIGIFLSSAFVGSFTKDANVFSDATIYLRIITIGSFFFMLQLAMEKIIQSTGQMVLSMIVTIVGALVNLVLDPILIFGLLGAPKMGIAGAAVATIIGQAASSCVALYICLKKISSIHIRIFGFRSDKKTIKDIYNVGLPSMVMMSINSIMVLGYNAILAAHATAIAVLGIYFKLQSIILMPVFGVNQAAMPILGYNFGARKKDRFMETYRKALGISVIIMIIGMALFQIFPRELLMIFSASDNMFNIGIPALRIISLCFVPAAFGIIRSTVFQATGNGIYSLIASVVRQLVGILPIAYILMQIGGVTMSWYSFPIAEIMGFVLSSILFRKLQNTKINQLDTP